MTIYTFRLKGHLDPRWESFFDGFSITHQYNVDQQPFSLMTGKVIDQSALYGVLARMRDLGVDLISLQPEPHSEVPGSSPVDLSSSLDKSQKHQQHKKSDKQQQ